MTDATLYYLCGNRVLDNGEECDRGTGCNSDCQCSRGFTPSGSLDCVRCKYAVIGVDFLSVQLSVCGNGVLDSKEECDGGAGCLNITCRCNTNLGYQAINSTECSLGKS